MNEILNELKGVVQYRRKGDGIQWTTIAAFDVEDLAVKYAESCGGEEIPWEYRAVDLNGLVIQSVF